MPEFRVRENSGVRLEPVDQERLDQLAKLLPLGLLEQGDLDPAMEVLGDIGGDLAIARVASLAGWLTSLGGIGRGRGGGWGLGGGRLGFTSLGQIEDALELRVMA